MYRYFHGGSDLTTSQGSVTTLKTPTHLPFHCLLLLVPLDSTHLGMRTRLRQGVALQSNDCKLVKSVLYFSRCPGHFLTRVLSVGGAAGLADGCLALLFCVALRFACSVLIRDGGEFKSSARNRYLKESETTLCHE